MQHEQLKTLNTLFDENKYQEILIAVADIDVDESFLPRLALAYFHTENYDEAKSIFENLCQKNGEPICWFNLCTSSIMAGETQKGLDALHQAIKLNREKDTNGEGIPTPFMYLYATRALLDSEQYNQAFNQLNELAEIYASLHITDSHFLYMRGVPFFDEFVKLSRDVLAKQEVTDHKQWITYVSSRLDDEGKETMKNLILKE